MRPFAAALALAALAAAGATAGGPEEEEEDRWSFSASAYTYLVPDDDDYVQPTFTADRGALHLEARYNYEAPRTGSAWLGYNFAGGEDVEWELTPMAALVLGDVAGFAPGYKASLGWWKLAFYSEGEYLFDAGDSAESFFYNWSELTLAPWSPLRFGLVTQRTRLYEAEREIERGFLLGLSTDRVEVTTYVLDPDGEATLVFAVALSF